MNIKLLLICALVCTFVFSSLQQTTTPLSTLGANCVLVSGMSNAIFEYAQNATHLVAQVRVAALTGNGWVGLGMGISSQAPMGTSANPLTVYVAFKSGSSVSYNEYSSAATGTPTDIGSNYALATSLTTSNGVTTFTVVRTVERPAGASGSYFEVPTTGSFDVAIAYLDGSSTFSKHSNAEKITVATTTTQNACPRATNSSYSLKTSLALVFVAIAMLFM